MRKCFFFPHLSIFVLFYLFVCCVCVAYIGRRDSQRICVDCCSYCSCWWWWWTWYIWACASWSKKTKSRRTDFKSDRGANHVHNLHFSKTTTSSTTVARSQAIIRNVCSFDYCALIIVGFHSLRILHLAHLKINIELGFDLIWLNGATYRLQPVFMHVICPVANSSMCVCIMRVLPCKEHWSYTQTYMLCTSC